MEKEINLSARRQRIQRGIFGDGKYLVRRGEEEQRRKGGQYFAKEDGVKIK